MTARIAFLALAFAALLPAASAQAQPVEIEFVGADGVVVTADEAWLSELPPLTQEVRFQTSQGPGGGVFEGVSLLGAVQKAGLLARGEGHPELRQAVIVTASDGYEILYSVGEMAPDFGAAPIMIATGLDGSPLPEGEAPRIVVPGDTRGARALYGVVRIAVR